jgi:ketosteroid isomerase-like protein
VTHSGFAPSIGLLHDPPKARDQVMTITATDNLAIARRYLEAIENGTEGGALAEFFAKDVVQEEFPNRLSPIGVHRDLNSLLASARKGKQVIRAQKFDILNCVVDGDNVALEVFWTGLLATSVEGLPANSELRAHVSIFLEFRDGKICRQHNYDCFDPWWV